MERRKPLKRTPFKPPEVAAFKPPKSRKPINPRSTTKKRRREQAAGPSMGELRPSLWARCGGHCERCAKGIAYDTFDAHHRKFRSRGGKDELINLVALCGECHLWAHREGRAAGLSGFSVMASADPGTIPVKIHLGRATVLLTTTGKYHPIQRGTS